MTVLYAPHAVQDLRDLAGRTISADDRMAATHLIERLFRAVHQLAHGVFEGPAQRLRSGRTVRSWPAYPSRIYYRRTTDALQILRVYHQA